METRSHIITMRLGTEERARFEAVAKDMGLDVSAMIRALVRAREKEVAVLVEPPGRRRRPSKKATRPSKKAMRT